MGMLHQVLSRSQMPHTMGDMFSVRSAQCVHSGRPALQSKDTTNLAAERPKFSSTAKTRQSSCVMAGDSNAVGVVYPPVYAATPRLSTMNNETEGAQYNNEAAPGGKLLDSRLPLCQVLAVERPTL